MTPVELRRKGIAALCKELGYVGIVRFLQQFDSGSGNYTEERHQWLDHLTIEDIKQQIQQRRDRMGN